MYQPQTPSNPMQQDMWLHALNPNAGRWAPGQAPVQVGGAHASNPWSPGQQAGGMRPGGGVPMMQGMFGVPSAMLQRWASPGQGATV